VVASPGLPCGGKAGRGAPSLRLVFATTLVLSSAFQRWFIGAPAHAVAASAGTVLTYGWTSLRRLVVAGGTSLGVPTTTVDVIGQALLLFALLSLGAAAVTRLRLPAPHQSPAG
jgi:hypothetical protein